MLRLACALAYGLVLVAMLELVCAEDSHPGLGREIHLSVVFPKSDQQPVQLTADFDSVLRDRTITWVWYLDQSANKSQEHESTCEGNFCIDHANFTIAVGEHNVSVEAFHNNSSVASASASFYLPTAISPQTTLGPRFAPTGEVLLQAAIPNANLTGDVSCNWNFGDGAVSWGASCTDVPHIYAAPGMYNVTVLLSNAVSALNKSVSVQIQDRVTQLELKVYTPYYLGQPIQFNASVQSGSHVRYQWVFGDGHAYYDLGPHPQHIFPEARPFRVNCTAYNGVSHDTVSMLLVVGVPAASSESAPIALAVGVSVGVLVALVLVGVAYHRYYRRAAKAETADFTFISPRAKQRLGRARASVSERLANFVHQFSQRRQGYSTFDEPTDTEL
eukprot:m.230143 g.230143  ORF g.230143 m.230143 type:complete len:388 (+) comp12018_c0_seq1:51-1214(+)